MSSQELKDYREGLGNETTLGLYISRRFTAATVEGGADPDLAYKWRGLVREGEPGLSEILAIALALRASTADQKHLFVGSNIPKPQLYRISYLRATVRKGFWASAAAGAERLPTSKLPGTFLDCNHQVNFRIADKPALIVGNPESMRQPHAMQEILKSRVRPKRV